jgi:rfaE bifunctional protein nucleotidyltransferase chain/domain
MCAGCFDILHFGHLLHLRAAKEHGDWLVVALTADHQIRKRPGGPAFKQDQRAEMLLALRVVDQVVIYTTPTPEEAIRMVRPQIYAKGADYLGKDIPERALVEELGGRVIFTTTQKWSSTELAELST